MTRQFNESDKNKKKARIRLSPNPVNLAPEMLAEIETRVKASLREGYLSCPVAWRIARDLNIPRIAVGAVTDQLGNRITDCQIGCFKVDKTPFGQTGQEPAAAGNEVAAILRELYDREQLTCQAVFDLASRVKLKPSAVSHHVNVMGFKVRECQLGCF